MNASSADYATGGGQPMPVLQAAAINASGSVKGGPYSVRPAPGGRPYGYLEMEETARRIHVRFRGRRVGTRVEEVVGLRLSVT